MNLQPWKNTLALKTQKKNKPPLLAPPSKQHTDPVSWREQQENSFGKGEAGITQADPPRAG